MADVKKAIEDMEEIISYFRAVTSTSGLEQKARNVYKFLKKQHQIILCKGIDNEGGKYHEQTDDHRKPDQRS